MSRPCVVCGAVKALAEYPVSPRGRDGHERRCKECRKAYQREYRKRPDVHARITAYSRSRGARVNKNSNLVRMYGVTLAQYERLLAEQGGRCPVCTGPLDGGKHTHVDHCHAAGHVRGLLCGTCNRGLGQFQDDPALLRAAALYLERNQHHGAAK